MKRIILAAVCAFMALSLSAQNDYKVAVFGTMTDGVTDNTATIQRAIDFISEKGGGTLTFNVGRYLTGALELKSNVTLKLGEGAVLVCSANIYSYHGRKALINAEGAENISIIGRGCIDGNSAALRANYEEQVEKGHIPASGVPALVSFSGCSNAKVEGIKVVNPAGMTFDGVSAEGVSVYDYAAGTCLTPEGKILRIQK
jgi:Endopolygalacturonase